MTMRRHACGPGTPVLVTAGLLQRDRVRQVSVAAAGAPRAGDFEPLIGGQIDGFVSSEAAADDRIDDPDGLGDDSAAVATEPEYPLVRYVDQYGDAPAVLRLIEAVAGGFVVKHAERCDER